MDIETRRAMETKLGFISQYAASEPQKKFHSIMHHVNEDSLKANFYELGRRRAVGVDGVSWQEYEERLEANIDGLIERMRRMGYRPQPARRVYIPKDDGTNRPLGIPVIEDKIVQKAMSQIMEAIYEGDFHECSYGFRVGRSSHQALKRVSDLIFSKPINHVIEADIKGFFDNVPHKRLIGLVRRRITDKRFLRYLVRFLKAGYMESGILKEAKLGTPQGGNLSPMLANIFLHYVLDEWFEKGVRPRMRGQGYLVRYCDDFVILVQYKEEAEIIMKLLVQRFSKYELELNARKSGVKSFGRYETENAKRQGRKANTFDFLGFTHYCTLSRGGKFKVGRKTGGKKFRKSCKAMGKWLRSVRNEMTLKDLWRVLKVKLQGHYQYYGVSENSKWISIFYLRTEELVYKWLNRRSQKKSFSWEEFQELLRRYPLPKPRLVHNFYAPSYAG